MVNITGICNRTLFIKDFKNGTKQDNINIVNSVRKKIFENQNRVNIQEDTPLVKMTIGEEYLFSTLSIT